MHSLRLSDRTMSYDAGLNMYMHQKPPNQDHDDNDEANEADGTIIIDPHNGATIKGKSHRKISTDTVDQADDGIGTSDDETNSNSSSTGPTQETSEESSSSPNMGQSRRVIKLDLAAISQLLAFDEEEEEGLESEEDDEDQLNGNKAWKKTIAKDLAKLTAEKIRRRHSITLCESRNRKSSTESTTSSVGSEASSTSSPSKEPSNPFASLNVTSSMQDSSDTSIQDFGTNVSQGPMKTLNLRLEEVAHIRSVLTKAELEAMAIDSTMRDNIARGKVCFHCLKTKFGIFSRGQKCEICKQLFCNRCHTKMRIPIEHFSTTPVFALSPIGPIESQSKRIELDQSLNNPQGLQASSVLPSRKVSLPSGYHMASGVGSAPSSPKSSPKSSQETLSDSVNHSCDQLAEQNQDQPLSLLPTISGMMVGASQPPASLPPFMLNKNNNSKYATLPTKTRRLSWMSARDAQRERLEGSLLTVCVDCKDMVVQVIRVSRTTKRHSRAEFSSITPDNIRDFR